MSRHLTHHSSHTHHTHHSPARPLAGSAATRSPISKRRSNRMALHATVALSGEDRGKFAFKVQAKATNLNKHGAAVQLQKDLAVGSMVMIRHQRGVEVSARVVSQIAAVEGLCTYGVEFVEHDEKSRNFWGINFPSA